MTENNTEKKPEKRNSGKNFIVKLIQLILLLVILYSLYNIGSYYYGRYKAGKEFDEYKDIVQESLMVGGESTEAGSEDNKSIKLDPKVVEKLAEVDLMNMDEKTFKSVKKEYGQVAKISLDAFAKKNSDIVSYINIPGTSVSYPVVYKDNSFYLRRNLKKQYSDPGTIFIEEKNHPDFTDMNTVLYGHNMSNAYIRSAEMFEPILNWRKGDFVNSKDQHIIEIYTKNGVSRYRVFSAYFSTATYDYRTLNMDDKKDWVNYLEELKSRSIQTFKDTEFGPESRIITLSTCDNVNDDGRFAVHAILLNEE